MSMSEKMTIARFGELRGAPVYDSSGKKIGKVDEIYCDLQTQVPEWLGIGTGLFGKKRVLVPAVSTRERGDGVAVAYTKDQVKDSPDIDSDEISMQKEQELASYYGLGYSQERSSTGLPEGMGVYATAEREGQAVTRMEEELQVGKRPVEAGRARLRKWVETEPVEAEVTLQRETAYVTREHVDQPVGKHEFGEEQVEVPLRGEEPVVRKQAVAKERIGIGTDVRSERETVQEEVRKERVEVEGADTEERPL
jgi:uncharacterized protein (TIGR02271 family)